MSETERSAPGPRRWWTLVIAGVVLAAVVVVWVGRDRPELDMALWCERAIAMVQADEDLALAEVVGGYEQSLPEMEAAVLEREAALLELVQPEELDGLIPYGGDASKYVPVWDFVAAECGYRFNVNNGRLPEPG